MRQLKVLLVDDQPLFIEGLRNLLTAHGMQVVGMANDGLEALAKARALRPDVILMDIEMPRCNGLQATRMIKSELPDIMIVMLTVSAEDEDLFAAIKSGASGYMLKSLQAKEFFELLTDLSNGEAPLSKGLAARIMKEFARQSPKPEATTQADAGEVEKLTGRQMEVLTLVAQGLTYREIGASLFLSERTVKYHMGQILELLHLESRAHAIAYAERVGLATPKKEDDVGG